jgi:uncharacterized repeat protein (TIGR02543 family)
MKHLSGYMVSWMTVILALSLLGVGVAEAQGETQIVGVKLILQGTNGLIETKQPLVGQNIGVEAQLSNVSLDPQSIKVWVTYVVGTNTWGVFNAPAEMQITKPLSLVSTSECIYRITGDFFTSGISGQDKYNVVQYLVWAEYYENGSNTIYQSTNSVDHFTNPSWYFPVDLNKRNHMATGVPKDSWTPYYITYDVPPGSVWINEMNMNENSSILSQKVFMNPYIEIAQPASISLKGWTVEILDRYYMPRLVKTIDSNAIVSPVLEPGGNGYGLFVVGPSDFEANNAIPTYPPLSTTTVVHQAVQNIRGDSGASLYPSGYRLKRPMGMYEHAISCDWDPQIVSWITGETYVNNESFPQTPFRYVGREHYNGSLAFTGAVYMVEGQYVRIDNTNSWQQGVATSNWTPGRINSGQTFEPVPFLPTQVVTFDGQGGTPNPLFKIVSYNAAYGRLATVEKMGYTFTGWFTKVSGGGTRITSESTVSITKPQTLYAKWTAKSYTVILNPNGGTSASPSITATYNSAMPSSTAPSRVGYSFKGYFDLPEGGNQYYSSSMTSITNWTIASESILYAQWISHGTLQFQSASYGVSENNELGLAALRVERVLGSYGSASVTFVVEPNTATPNDDYSAYPYTLTWNNGQTGTRTLMINDIYDDLLVEGNESFTVRLINATGAVLGEPDEALVTIVDDDAAESRIIRIEGGTGPSALNFGSVATNSVSMKTVYVWNDGNQPMSVTNVTVAAGFSVSQTSFTVAAGSMQAVDITFAPALLQAYTGSLVFWCVNATGASTMTLSGMGVEPPPTVAMRSISGLSAIIAIDVATNATVLAIEDTLAPGLFPVSISDGGSWDSVNRKVKWFFNKKGDIRDRAVQYTVNVLGNVVGGVVNFGSGNSSITGETVFSSAGNPGVLHPADANGDWRVTIEEVSAHITRWKQGLEDVKTSYAIRGVTLYLLGESYVYDANVPPSAKRWIPSVTPAPSAMSLGSPETTLPVFSEPLTAGAVRQAYLTNVTITVSPEAGTLAYGLEETIPEGLSVAAISDEGFWDANYRKIKWSFDDGTPRSLSYAVMGSEGTNVTLTGLVSFDGSEDPITGQSDLAMPVTFGTWASRNGLPSSDLPGLFGTVSPVSGAAYGFEYAFGTNMQSSVLLNIRCIDGRCIIETPIQDGLSLPYVNISILGSTNLVEWTLPITPSADLMGKPANCNWHEPSALSPSAFFKLKAELK